MSNYALIIAGGVGARFWPRSRQHTPKQLLQIIGEGTMIQNTVARLNPFVPVENILIITNALQADEVHRQLPAIPQENIVIEPHGRNTAPAVALGAEIMKKRYGDVPMIVLPSDHIIHDVQYFHEVLRNAVQVAQEHRGLVTIGINPTRPETGYGYIQMDMVAASQKLEKLAAFPVRTFAEKPNLSTAERFLESGDFVWNSGMFIWTVGTVLSSIAEFLPDISDEMHRLSPAIDTPKFASALDMAYREMRGISIDYGIMEKASNRYVIPADFGWNDLGSWDEVFRLAPKDEHGNSIAGEVVVHDSYHCQISTTPNRIVGVIGMEDCSIIDTDDAVLVYRHGRSQDVKEIVDYLRKRNMNTFL